MPKQTNTPTQSPDIEKPWAKRASEIVETLDVSVSTGLSEAAVERRRETYGENRLRDTESRSAWQILVEQFASLIMALLAIASVTSFIFGDVVEGFAILVVIVLNATIGFVTELRAVRSMEALKELSSVTAKVRRDGNVQEIPAEQLVPGDILVLTGGDVITADVRLIEASKLQADESALTGESVPVAKQTDAVSAETPLAERTSMVYKGTAVTRGAGEGIIVTTGMATELGQISELVAQAEEEATPLEERLDVLGRKLIGVTLGIAVFVAISGIIAGREIQLMIETAIALAVASVPEGLPIVATVALARGMWRMAQRNALINRLSAVETLGATNVILTDKTGTLTENRMTAARFTLHDQQIGVTGHGLATEGEFYLEDENEDNANLVSSEDNEELRRALKIGVLCNNADLGDDLENLDKEDTVGDPLEIALLIAGIKAGLRRTDLLNRTPEVREVAFEAETKMMATYHKQNGHYLVAVKGALEAVIDASSEILTSEGQRPLDEDMRRAWLERNESLAADGLRVIALAEKSLDAENIDLEDNNPYKDLMFVGLAALLDPPREEVRSSPSYLSLSRIRPEMQSQRMTEAIMLPEPIQTQAEVAFVAATLFVDQIPQAAFHHPTAQRDEIDERDTDAQHQALQPRGISDMRRFQIKAVILFIPKHLFDPHPFAVRAQDAAGPRLIGNQIPGLILIGIPMQDQPKPAHRILLGQAHPPDSTRFAGLQLKVIQLLPLLTRNTNLDTPLLAHNKVPVAPTEPAQQRHMLKFSVAQHQNVRVRRQQSRNALKQRQLLRCRRVTARSFVHTPRQGQGTVPIRQTNHQQTVVKAHLRGVNDQAHLLSLKHRQNLPGQRSIPSIYIHRFIGQKAPQAVHQTDLTSRHRPFTNNLTQMNAAFHTQAGDQQGQVTHARDPRFG